MSRTDEEYRRQDARRKGYVAGKYGDDIETNPYRYANESGTWHAWRDGWEAGRADKEAPPVSLEHGGGRKQKASR